MSATTNPARPGGAQLPPENEPTPRLPSAQPEVFESEERREDDDSSLTSLSDLEERPNSRQSNSESSHSLGRTEAGSQKEGTTLGAGEEQLKQSPGMEAKKEQKRKADPKPPFLRTKHRLEVTASTPQLDELLSQREQHFEEAIREGTNNYALQENSFAIVQAAVESLPTGEQQAMISLMLNRYSSFCVAVDIPLFPLSPVKIALFLSQTLAVDFRSSCIRGIKLRLPTIDPNDSSLSREEGQRLTRELAEAWIQALGFAQLATKEIWEKVHPSSGALDTLARHPAILEIVAAIPSIQTWQEWQARGELSGGPPVGAQVQTTAASATRWTKKGKAVAGPSRSGREPSESYRQILPAPRSTPMQRQPPSGNAYAFEMPLP